MSSIRKNTLLQLFTKAPNSRDYYGITITTTHVIFNIWNVSRSRYVFPKCRKADYKDFLDDASLQNEVKGLFGAHVLEYALGICSGEKNLQYLPSKIFLRVLRYLASNDILRLSRTSKIFFELCNGENVWELLFKKRLKRYPIFDDYETAHSSGWRNLLKNKVNKQLKGQKKNAFPVPANNQYQLGSAQRQRSASTVTSNTLKQRDLLNNCKIIPKNTEMKQQKLLKNSKVDTTKGSKSSLLSGSNANVIAKSMVDLQGSCASLTKNSNLEKVNRDINKGKGSKEDNNKMSSSSLQKNFGNNTEKITGEFNKNNLLKNKVVKMTKASAVDLLESFTKDLQKNKANSMWKSDINKSNLIAGRKSAGKQKQNM